MSREPGEGTILAIRCICGHDVDRHRQDEICEAEGCVCTRFELDWDDGIEGVART